MKIQARAAGGFSKHASMYSREWETCEGTEGFDAELCATGIAEFKAFDLEDGNGQHTEYRAVD